MGRAEEARQAMYLSDALIRIKERLETNGARVETLRLLDTIGRQPGADRAQVGSQIELVRRLMRTPVANANVGVYDDLAVLEEQMASASAEASARRAAEENRAMPKSKKYYKALREKEERDKERKRA